MSFRFLFITSIVLLLISGVSGWLVTGEREPTPEEKLIMAYEGEIAAARAAAETGDAAAWTAYADLLATGPEELRDYKVAMEWYRKAAREGYALAQVGIGELHEHGRGVSQNHHRAVEWYETATRLSREPRAYFKMGEAYFRGLGTPQDYGAALRWYRTAAAGGHPVAQFILGSMYEAGWGVDQDRIKAWTWYRRALSGEDQVAAHEEDYDVRQALARIERRMNQSQIDAARRAFEDATRP